MGAVSGQLTARLLLTGDATGVVGAAEETVVALDQVKAKAAQTGAAVAGTTAEFNAAALALKGQTDATAKATAAITASGAARTSEVARLRDQGAAAESTIAKVQALSKAHGEYNGTMASARALVAAKQMSEAQYAAVASAASAKLAADLAAVRVEATASGMALGRMEANLAKLGRAGGISRSLIGRVRGAAAAVPEFIGAFPVISATAGAAAAIGVLIAAEQTYEASIGHLNVTLQAHGMALASTNERYLSLAGDIASVAKTSTISAREMEASFANSHLDTSLWSDVAAMSRDYAAVLGTDIPAAAAKAAENLEKPYEWAVQLTQQYGLFDQATLKHIRDLEEQGKVTEAQKIITDGWAARIKNAADQTSGWARAWSGVSTAVSNTWDAIGRGLFGSKSEELNLELKNAQSDLDWRLNAKKSGYKMANLDDQIVYYRQRVAAIKAELKSIDPNTEKRNRESAEISGIINGYGLNSYDVTLRRLTNERKRIEADAAKGIPLIGIDGNAITKEKALADNDREITKTKKARAEAERNENQVEKDHYETVQQLLKGAPQLIAQSELDAKTAQGRVRAYQQGSSALAAFNDEQEVAKAILPYTTALAWAQGTAHDRLADTIARVTKEKRGQLAADHALAAMQDIDQQVGSASGYMSDILADAKLAQNEKIIADWYAERKKVLTAASADADKFTELEQLRVKKVADALDEDLRNRRDWASGVIRANNDLTRSQQDWASRSEGFIRGWAQTGEDAFADFAKTGKLSIGSLTDFVVDQFARMVYQKYIAETMNSVGSSILDQFGSVLNISGGGSSSAKNAGGSSSSIWSDVISWVGELHGGGDPASPQFTRAVPAALFYGAEKYHGGGPVLKPGERPIIAKDREWMLTEDQQLNSGRMLDRWEAALNRPAVLQLPAGASGMMGSQPPKLEVHYHGGDQPTATQSYDPSTNTMRLDLRKELTKAVAATVRGGEADSAIGARFGLSPTVIRRS